jgi:phosphoglycolate phosphatase
MIEAVLIDLDGTLVDTVYDLHAAVGLVAKRYGLSAPSVEEVKSWIGKGSRQLMSRLLEHQRGRSSQDVPVEQALAVFYEAYESVNGLYARPYPDVIAALKAMRQAGLPIACVTNKVQAATDLLLEKLGMTSYFDIVLGGVEGRALKPHPDVLFAACAAFGADAARAVMIGDSENDLQAARAAGSRCLLVPYGYSVGQPVQSLGADAIVPTLLAAVSWMAAHPDSSLTQE